jgi:hypothetical protein
MAVPGISNTNSYQTNQQGMQSSSPGLFGTDAYMQQFETLTPEHKSYLQQLLGGGNANNNAVAQNPLYQSGTSFLQSLLSSNNEDFARPYQQAYQQDIQKLGNQFSGLGSLSSSAFQNAAAGRTADLQNSLANLNTNSKLQGLGPALSYSQAPTNAALQGLGVKGFGNEFVGRQPGFLENLLMALASGASGGIGSGIGKLLGGFEGFGTAKPSSAVGGSF